jgi:hypothetical protein
MTEETTKEKCKKWPSTVSTNQHRHASHVDWDFLTSHIADWLENPRQFLSPWFVSADRKKELDI